MVPLHPFRQGRNPVVGGLYSAAAGMAAQQAWLDSLSNDVANVNTDGYKQARIAFRDLAYNQSDGVAVGTGSAAADAGRSFQQGPLSDVNDPLAIAIEGPGFFQVTRPNGQNALTRAGKFELDANGSLVTAAGDRLVPPIALPRGVDPSKILVAGDGTLSVNGRALGRITVVDVQTPTGLQPVGDNLFQATQASGAPVATNGSRLKQGQIEGSNVSLSDAMVDMVQAQRGFELQSRVIKTQDQLMEIANGLRH
jgi:flagellar basal-body rod protein FlgG